MRERLLYGIENPFDYNRARTLWEKYRKKAIQLGAIAGELPAETTNPLYDLTKLGKWCGNKAKGEVLPLGEKPAAVLELLKAQPEHKALTGKEILQQLDAKNIIIDQSTLTKSIIPTLRPYGVRNERKGRAGYYIQKISSANIP